MKIFTYTTKKATSKKAAELAISIIKEAIKKKGKATFIAATGASQLDFIDEIVAATDVDWEKTRMFHLDEYIDLPESHPASFRKYLRERLIDKIGNIGEVILINGEAEDPEEECRRLKRQIEEETIDVAFVGVGENGHLAFNDPPADFEVQAPYIIVDLDETCRQQQVNEGWFNSLEEVPESAISMSVSQIMKAENVIATVPGKRKAQAVKECFGDDKVTPEKPSSILKEKDRSFLFLDQESSSLLNE